LLVLEIQTRDAVTGDYLELRSALSNLVMNALKYSPEDQPVVLRWERTGETLQLSVTDNGIGIEEQHLPRLTERFYRVDESRSSSTGGTGLGLAIVKHVAASHRAELLIESQPGRGSTFTLQFPLS
jgi:two-component system phosphate regulon sensor histidine kinase PhoR